VSIEWFPIRAAIARFLASEIPRYDAELRRGFFCVNWDFDRSNLIAEVPEAN
jgi:hypothetical protein